MKASKKELINAFDIVDKRCLGLQEEVKGWKNTASRQSNDICKLKEEVEELKEKDNLQIAIRLIRAMCADNGACFCSRATLDYIKNLSYGVERMKQAGLEFNDRVISNMSAGESSEIFNAYSKYDGWKVVDEILNYIFDGETPQQQLEAKLDTANKRIEDLECDLTIMGPKAKAVPDSSSRI